MKRPLYLTIQNSKAHYRAGEIAVESRGMIIDKFPANTIRDIYIFGKVEISPSLMNFIMRRGINSVFLTIDGRFKGRMANQNHKMIKLRLGQYELIKDEISSLRLAAAIVKAKLSNQRAFLIRSNREKNKTVSSLCGQIRLMAENTVCAENKGVLMGIEGIGAKYYWEGFRMLLRQNLGFAGRKMHPPPDPVNAMLSFGYIMLFNEISNLCQIEGLDIYAGVLHAVEDRRASLALDLMEEFRTAAVDHAILRAVNKKVFDHCDFEVLARGEKVYLNEHGRPKIINIYRERLNECIVYKDFKDKAPLIMAIKHQIENFKAFLRGQCEYAPFYFFNE